jgi:hypothetical protein
MENPYAVARLTTGELVAMKRRFVVGTFQDVCAGKKSKKSIDRFNQGLSNGYIRVDAERKPVLRVL